MRYLSVSILFCSMVAFGSGAIAVHAQLPTQSPARGQSNQPSMPTLDSDGRGSREGRDGSPGNELTLIQEAQRVKAMANSRQKRIVDDTAKLLQLATELKAAVDKSTKDQLSLDVIRKAEEIEKLARDVKQRMRN